MSTSSRRYGILSPDLGLLIFRVLVALVLFLYHGLHKFNALISGEIEFIDPIGIGVTASLILSCIAEFLCAILIMLGIKTRWAAAVLVINFLVVVFVVHGPEPFAAKQLQTLFLSSFVALLFAGGGKYSLDRLF